MQNDILEFDRREITKEEMSQHVKYYLSMAEEGMKLFSTGKKKEALTVLREIRHYMEPEYKYYQKVSVEKYIFNNRLYSTYVAGLTDAFVKQIRPNSYEMLHSNLYDIYDYISNYGMEVFFKDNK